MPATPPRQTFSLVQALRGLAALWVVLFHIKMGEHVTNVTTHMPAWLSYALFDCGSAGVAVFFVLSGFVITHSLTRQPMRAADFGRFVARRSLRLDPAYWASIVLTLVLAAIYAWLKQRDLSSPGVGVVAAHLVYLQELLRLSEIDVVYWTLTYEVQFYLVIAIAWWGTTALVDRGVGVRRAWLSFMTPLGILAFISAALARDWALHGLFVNLWHGFFLGLLGYEAGVRNRGRLAFLALVVTTLLGAMHTKAVFGMPCAVTAIVLMTAARTGYLERGLASKPWQFFGRISYSIYLVHVPVLTLGFAIWGRLAGRGFIADLGGFMVVGSVIILAATIFWWAIERPSHVLATRVFRKVPPSVSASAI